MNGLSFSYQQQGKVTKKERLKNRALQVIDWETISVRTDGVLWLEKYRLLHVNLPNEEIS